MPTFDHMFVILAALFLVLGAYVILVLSHGGGGEFLQAAIVGLAGAIAGAARSGPPGPP